MRTIIATLLLLAGIPLLATPSTLIWIPSTDIQPKGVWHLGVDTYVYTGGTTSPAPFVDAGLTYGVTPRIELGVDAISGTGTPLWVNGKIQLLAPGKSPLALVAGIYNVGTKDATNQELAYVEGSYVLFGTRLSLGAYKGREAALASSLSTQVDDTGLLAGVDRVMGKWWFGADYQSGNNAVGALNFGIGYAFTDKVGVILGYDIYNVGGPNSINFQFDANL